MVKSEYWHGQTSHYCHSADHYQHRKNFDNSEALSPLHRPLSSIKKNHHPYPLFFQRFLKASSTASLCTFYGQQLTVEETNL
jgi:hypothetical protein